MRSVSAVIPNFDGRDLLERYLPSVVREVRDYPGSSETILVDDGSQDGSIAYVRERYPDVKVVYLGRNLGALEAKNAGFDAAANDLILCLNNDIELRPGFLPPLARPFEDDPGLFGVGPRVLLMDGSSRDEGMVYGEVRRGRFELIQPGLADASYSCPDLSPVLYPHGGACLYDRAKLRQLGGYDRLLHPIYWDDIDVGYVAWKRGWRCLYQPESVALHQHMATTVRTEGLARVSALLDRNRLLFTWKNLTDGPLVRSHLLWLSARIIVAVGRRDRRFLGVLGGALGRLPLALESRRRESGCRQRSDAEVLVLSRPKASKAKKVP